MNTNLVIVVVMAWIILAILAGIGEGVYLGQSAYGGNTTNYEASTLEDLFNPTDLTWFGTLFKFFTFDFDGVFTGGWMVLKYVFFAPLVVALYVGLFGTISGFGAAGLAVLFGATLLQDFL